MNGPWSDAPSAWVDTAQAWQPIITTVAVGVATASLTPRAATIAVTATVAVAPAGMAATANPATAAPDVAAPVDHARMAVAAGSGATGIVCSATVAPASLTLTAQAADGASLIEARGDVAGIAVAARAADAIVQARATPLPARLDVLVGAAQAEPGIAAEGEGGLLSMLARPATVSLDTAVLVERVGLLFHVWPARAGLMDIRQIFRFASPIIVEANLELPMATDCTVASDLMDSAFLSLPLFDRADISSLIKTSARFTSPVRVEQTRG